MERNNRFVLLIGIFLCCILVLVSCGKIVGETTATLEIIDTPTPTNTLSLTPTLTATPLPSFTPTPMFSLQGRITFIYSEGLSYIAYLDSNYEINLLALEDFDYARDYAFSPDGKMVAISAIEVGEEQDQGVLYIQIFEVETGKMIFSTPILFRNSVQTNGYSWSLDSEEIAYSIGGDIWVLNVFTLEQTRLTYTLALETFPDWSPDGRYLVFEKRINGISELYLLDLETEEEIQLTNLELSGITKGYWSPNSKEIAFHGNDEEIYIISAENGEAHQVTYNNALRSKIHWSPDGTRIAYVASDGDIEIYIIGSDGSGIVQVTNNRIRDLYPCWSPDGQYIAYVTSDDVNKSLVISSVNSIIQEILFNGIITIQDPMWVGD